MSEISLLNPAWQELCDFVFGSHNKFAFQFAKPQKASREFMVDLASKLSRRLFYKESIETCEPEGTGSSEWR